jgi:hypothetical protein
MYVIKKGDRYVADAEKENSFTKVLDRACVWDHKSGARTASFPECNEAVVEVIKNKQGKLVEVK